jgi:hypothetical protein
LLYPYASISRQYKRTIEILPSGVGDFPILYSPPVLDSIYLTFRWAENNFPFIIL